MRVASFVIVAVLAAFVVLLPGCGSSNGQGTILSAFTGGSAGTQGRGRVTTAKGAVVGGINADTVARRMDATDRQMAASAEYRALEYGQSGTSTAWKSPETPNRGTIVPGKPYKQGTVYCRAYTHTVYLASSAQTVRGTACRSSDGTWRTA